MEIYKQKGDKSSCNEGNDQAVSESRSSFLFLITLKSQVKFLTNYATFLTMLKHREHDYFLFSTCQYRKKLFWVSTHAK